MCVSEGACAMPEDTYETSGGFANYGGPLHDNHPINYVTADQASAYCGWLGKRLPTEAEWEKAARGGCEGWGEDCQTVTPVYPWGNERPTCDQAFFTQENGEICEGATEGTGPFGTRGDVGGRPAGASPYGIQDLAGSISEWTVDFYSTEFYANSPDKNPVASGDVGGETSDSGLVVRGGAFSDQPRNIDNLRSAARGKQVPYDGIDYLGFRCVRDE
jgi:formylglycine-generating enzyme required for sulfatase activity